MEIIFSQPDTSITDTETLLELISAPEESVLEENQNNLLLEELKLNPLNLNTTDIFQLQAVPFIDFNTAKAIIQHRKLYGRFFSEAELYSISDIPTEKVNQILDYVTVQEVGSSNNKLNRNKDYTELHFKLRSRFSGYIKQNNQLSYNSTPLKMYNRMIMSYEMFSAGFLTEKDPGEASLYDFVTFNLDIRIGGIMKEIILGDFSVDLGHGLILSSPYGLVKSSQAILPVITGKASITPYRSAQETCFLRGAAVHLNISDLSLLMFYSNKRFDSVFDSSMKIISAPVDGYHRSDAEINKFNNASEINLGTGLIYSHKDIFNARIFHYTAVFDKLRMIGLKTSKQYNFTSLSYDLNAGGMFLSGETAYDGNSLATLNHLSIPVSREIKIINSFRFYPQFITLHGNPFAERNSIIKDETGFYSGLSYHSTLGNFNIYFDQYQLRGSSFPLKGNEWLFNYLIAPPKTEINLIYRCSNKEQINSDNDILNETKQNYSIVIVYRINKKLRSKSRIDFKYVIPDKYEGYMYYQDFYYTLESFQIYSRLIFFKTENFSSAIYEYENNLPGTFQNNVLFGEGLRWYLVLKYIMNDQFLISLKYSETFKLGNSISPANQNTLDRWIGLQGDITF